MMVGFRFVQAASKYIAYKPLHHHLTCTTSNSKLQVPFRSGSSKWQLACVSAQWKREGVRKNGVCLPSEIYKKFFCFFFASPQGTSNWNAGTKSQKKWTKLCTSRSIFLSKKDEIRDLLKLFPRHFPKTWNFVTGINSRSFMTGFFTEGNSWYKKTEARMSEALQLTKRTVFEKKYVTMCFGNEEWWVRYKFYTPSRS